MREEINYKHVKQPTLIAIIVNVIVFSIFTSIIVNVFVFSIFTGLLILLFLMQFLTESIVIRFFLGENKPEDTSTNFYLAVIIVNIFTFPITQIITFLFIQSGDIIENLDYILFMSIFIELIPLFLESVLNLKIYEKFNEISYFIYPIENRTIILFTIAANLISTAFGLLILYGILSISATIL